MSPRASAGIAFQLCRVAILTHPLFIAGDAYTQLATLFDPQVKANLIGGRHSALLVLGILSASVTCGFCLWAIELAVRFLTRGPRFVPLYCAFLALRVGTAIGFEVAMIASTGAVLLLGTRSLALHATRQIVAAVVWGGYLWRSEAVRRYLVRR